MKAETDEQSAPDRQPPTLSRRDTLRTAATLSLAALAGCAPEPDSALSAACAGNAYDPASPEDNLELFGKLQSDLSGRRQFSYRAGALYGLEADTTLPLTDYGRKVADVEGCSVKEGAVREDGAVVIGQRGWLFYKDPETGAYLRETTNPYTGERVSVPPFRAGIRSSVYRPEGLEMSAGFSMESTAFGRPFLLEWNTVGPVVSVRRQAFTRWNPPGGGPARAEMTCDTFGFDRCYLADRSVSHIPAQYTWFSQTEWLTWMKMPEDRAGHMLWVLAGSSTYDPADLPAAFVRHSEDFQRDVFTAPLSSGL